MPIDLNTWIKGLELPEADAKVILDALNKGGKKALDYLEGNQLRQEEFSRKMDAERAKITGLEKDLQKKIQDEDTYHSSLATWKTGSEKKLKEATEAREKAEQALAAARDRAKKLAEEFSIPDDQLTEMFKEAPAARHDTPPDRRTDVNEPDPRYVTREMFQVEAKSYAKLATLIPSLEREHFRLFGQDTAAPDWEKLIEDTIASAGKKTLAQVYSETYKVEDKRKELDRAARDAEIAKARQEGADAERAKLLADNPTMGTPRTSDRQGSPILDLARKQAADAAKDKAPPSRIVTPVEAAVRAFNERRYEGGREKVA